MNSPLLFECNFVDACLSLFDVLCYSIGCDERRPAICSRTHPWGHRYETIPHAYPYPYPGDMALPHNLGLVVAQNFYPSQMSAHITTGAGPNATGALQLSVALDRSHGVASCVTLPFLNMLHTYCV